MRKLTRVLMACAALVAFFYWAPMLPNLGWAESTVRPVERIPRAQFGVVGNFPLGEDDLQGLTFPSATEDERQAQLEGLAFFTTPHTAAEGLGPDNNQRFCLGCHRNSEEVLPQDSQRLITTVSHISRAARSTPTNFAFTSLDPATGGGRAADQDEVVDPVTGAITGTGRTAAFTIFGDFKPPTGPFNGLAAFGGFVQHTRPSLSACLPDRIPPIAIDPNLPNVVLDPITGLLDPPSGVDPVTGFRRTTGERAAPPYVGRGLMEAIADQDILDLADPLDAQGHNSSLAVPGAFPECPGDCIAGRPNMNGSDPGSGGVLGGDLPARADGGTTVRLGRFGLRAAGPTLVQFVIGGMQGELGFTSPLRPAEVNQADINKGRPGCVDTVPDPEIPISTVASTRSLIRLTPPPEFGPTLLSLLNASDPSAPRPGGSAAVVQRGAALFGVDLTAFANRMIPGRMPASGDGRDQHAINQSNRWLDCVGCHTPVQTTGQSPADVGAEHLSFVWAPVFSDLLLHKMTDIDAERRAHVQRLPVLVSRPYLKGLLQGGIDPGEDLSDVGGRLFATFDLPRNLADDTLPSQGMASGDRWRTPPLMGLGRIGPPFLHDARVYLSPRTSSTTPAGTVMTSSEFTNAPLVVRSLDDAIRAAIELHDLPAPDDAKTPNIAGAGCPVPAGGRVGSVDYGPVPQDAICPPYGSAASQINRSEAREVVRRYRSLSLNDQKALIAFLKEL